MEPGARDGRPLGQGPFAAMMLADMGAEVVRIDRVTPASGGLAPGLRARPELNPLDRGRRVIRIDLRQSRGVDAVLRLVERSDGLIEGFRPGVIERLGLGPEVCLERNPRLVYAGIPSVRLGARVMVRRVDLEAMLHGSPPDAA